jgi:hypothetical protein
LGCASHRTSPGADEFENFIPGERKIKAGNVERRSFTSLWSKHENVPVAAANPDRALLARSIE